MHAIFAAVKPKPHAITGLIGLLAVAPFFVLEWHSTSGYPAGIPWAVFISLWVGVVLFVGLLRVVLRRARQRASRPEWTWFASRIILLIILGWAVAYLVADQMPCFLGGKGC